ncbi:MAG TPA: YraN family protein [Hyphomicrobiales bacterium]|nr:YraN family protein [Hyphomicrobiales bacterium]
MPARSSSAARGGEVRASLPRAARRAAYGRGLGAEGLAALWLRLKGYRVLARRFATPVGEIDLVVRRGGTVAFVEVKARPSVEEALYALQPRQQARIVRAAEAFLARHPALAQGNLRFDVILVVPRRLPRHLPGAFAAD